MLLRMLLCYSTSMTNSIENLVCLMRSYAARMTLLLCMLSISLITEAFVPIRACPEPHAACKCISSEKSVSCTRLGSLTRRLPIGVPSDTKRLVVKFSTLNRLGPNAFRNSYLLEHIDLSHNWIADISESTFRNLIHLDTLKLSGNKLRFLDSNVFMHLLKLRVLDLSDNRFIVLTPQNFVHLVNLQSLDLHHNPIMCASPDAFYGLRMLQTLFVSNMSASLSDMLLSDTSSLSKLTVSYMFSLTFIPENFLAKNSMLQEIRFENLPKLNATGIPNTLFSSVENLALLSFSACNLSRVPKTVLDPVKWKLKSLDLSKNPLFHIGEKDLSFLYHLEKLNLRQTKLHTVEANALHLSSIVSIDLTINQLSTLKENVFGNKIPTSLESVKLGNNPWTCDCSLRWLSSSKFFQESDVQAICTEPPSMRGRDIYYTLKTLNKINLFDCHAPNITTFGMKSNAFNSLSLGVSQRPLTLTLSCQAGGYPKPRIRWIIMRVKSQFSERKLSISEWIHVQQNPLLIVDGSCDVCKELSRHPYIGIEVKTGGDLVFQSVSPCDAVGIYICEAENDIRSVQKKFIITRTANPVDQNTMKSFQDDSCSFSTKKKISSVENSNKNTHEFTIMKQFPSNGSYDAYNTKTFEVVHQPKLLESSEDLSIYANRKKSCILNTVCQNHGKKTGLAKSRIRPHASHAPNELNDQSFSDDARKHTKKNSQPSLRTSYFSLISFSIMLQLIKTND